MVDVFPTHAEVILRRGKGKRENNIGDEPNQSTLYTYMGMPQ
jgi:hypothetical protein